MNVGGRGHPAAAAPFLSGLDTRAMTSGFPATTATSLSSLGTGLAPGEHGVTVPAASPADEQAGHSGH